MLYDGEKQRTRKALDLATLMKVMVVMMKNKTRRA